MLTFQKAAALLLSLLAPAFVVSAETIVLVDPQGDELHLNTNSPVLFEGSLALPLTVDAEVTLHLAPLSITPGGIPSPFESGRALLSLDGVEYLAAPSEYSNDTLVLLSDGLALNCMSISGVPIHPASGVSLQADVGSVELRVPAPPQVVRITPRPSGGARIIAESVFGDVECGATFVDAFFSDGLEEVSM